MGKFKITYGMILFALLMVFLFVPIIQEWTDFIPVRPLKGVIMETPKPEPVEVAPIAKPAETVEVAPVEPTPIV